MKAQDRMESIKEAEWPLDRATQFGLSIQIIWQELKKDIVELAKKKSRKIIAPLERRARELQFKINLTLNNKSLKEDEKTIMAGILKEELS